MLFFPRNCLAVHATWSDKESEKEKATIDMNLGEARFAAETVRRNYHYRSWITISNKNTTEPGHDPPRNPGSPQQGARRHGPEANRQPEEVIHRRTGEPEHAHSSLKENTTYGEVKVDIHRASCTQQTTELKESYR